MQRETIKITAIPELSTFVEDKSWAQFHFALGIPFREGARNRNPRCRLPAENIGHC
jgi:hypothetical protein